MKRIYWMMILSAIHLMTFSLLCTAEDLSSSDPSETSASVLSMDEPDPIATEITDAGPSQIEESEQTIADPLEPLNRVSFFFNDKLYFWVLKPVAKGYKAIVPQEARIGLRNFFSNLTTPVRMANCLLQAKFKEAGNEVVRFFLNSTFGLAGFFDQAKNEFKIEKTEADFGQTLGVWGMGATFYINWFLLGPSNLRDTMGFAGDLLLDPRTYLFTDPIFYVVRPVDLINETSLTMGEYEELKKAALDPYIAVREAHYQYRQNKLKRKQGSTSSLPPETTPIPGD